MKNSKTKIKIFGERNTGTNYLEKLIELNFICKILPGAEPKYLMKVASRMPYTEYISDIYFALTHNYNLGWKHREVEKLIDTENKLKKNRNVKFICLIKNPYSWLLSLWNKPYHFWSKPYHFSINPRQSWEKQINSFDKFITTNWKTVARETKQKHYISPIDMWNKKVASYIKLQAKSDTVIVKYEDLLITTFSELERIKTSFELINIHDSLINYTNSTKLRDAEKDRDYYLDYYENEIWKNELTINQIKIINKSLNNKLLDYFNYQTL